MTGRVVRADGGVLMCAEGNLHAMGFKANSIEPYGNTTACKLQETNSVYQLTPTLTDFMQVCIKLPHY